jgi:thiol-disulfide isomerase/thioredoxin
MKTISIIIGTIILILGIGYLVVNNADEQATVKEEATTDTTLETEVIATEETTITEESINEVTTTDSAATAAATPGVYTAYDADAIAESNAEHILLFFHATWCPSCKALDGDIVANAESIPAGVEIYKVDYDTSTDLKRQYGITTQHSIIEIAASGEAESGISHGLTLEDVLATL